MKPSQDHVTSYLQDRRHNMCAETRHELTRPDMRPLLASTTDRMALSTSRCPGRQFIQLFRAWDTALATCGNKIKGRSDLEQISMVLRGSNTIYSVKINYRGPKR